MCQRRRATYTVVDENAAPGGKSSVAACATSVVSVAACVAGCAAVEPAPSEPVLEGPVEAQADISEADTRDAAARVTTLA